MLSTIVPAQEIKAKEKVMSHGLPLHLALEMVKREQTGRNIRGGSILEKSCMVILLCNNHHELWMPLLIQEFAGLKKINILLVKMTNVFHPRKELGAHTSIICSSSMFKTWLNCDSPTPSLN